MSDCDCDFGNCDCGPCDCDCDCGMCDFFSGGCCCCDGDIESDNRSVDGFSCCCHALNWLCFFTPNTDYNGSPCGVGGAITFYLFLLASDAVWQYFLINTYIYPSPPTAANHTQSAFLGFQAGFYIFGIIVTIINGAVAYAFLFLLFPLRDKSGDYLNVSGRVLWILAAIFAFAFTLFPTIGPPVIAPAVQTTTWNNNCNSFPYAAVLEGETSIASIFPSHGGNALVSYNLSSPDNGSLSWTFTRVNFDPTVNPNVVPIVQNITYYVFDNVLSSFSGGCSAAGSTAEPTPCVFGAVDTGPNFAFSILSTAYSASGSSTNVTMRAQRPGWEWSGFRPAVNLLTVDFPEGSGGQTSVLQTTVTNPKECQQLKVCVGTAYGEVGPEVLAPLGLLLMQQNQYAGHCGALG